MNELILSAEASGSNLSLGCDDTRLKSSSTGSAAIDPAAESAQNFAGKVAVISTEIHDDGIRINQLRQEAVIADLGAVPDHKKSSRVVWLSGLSQLFYVQIMARRWA